MGACTHPAEYTDSWEDRVGLQPARSWVPSQGQGRKQAALTRKYNFNFTTSSEITTGRSSSVTPGSKVFCSFQLQELSQEQEAWGKVGLGNRPEVLGPLVFPSPGHGKEKAGPSHSSSTPSRRATAAPGSERLSGVVIDQMLRLLSRGDRGAGRSGGWGMVVSMKALFLVLEEAVTQDGDHHHNTGSQEHPDGHLHRTWRGRQAR